MDNITHTLFALTLARTRLGSAGRGTMAALVIASNAPDVDAVAAVGGALNYLEWHRGPTHGPIGIIVLGLATAGLVSLGRNWLDARFARARDDAHNAPMRRLALVSIIGVLLHVAMDVSTPYGTRVLSPFAWQWVSTDWMPIVDTYMLPVLAAGLLLGRGPAARRRSAAIVLALITINFGIRAAAHQEAVALAPRAFGPVVLPFCEPNERQGPISIWARDRITNPASSVTDDCLVDVAAIPTFLSPFRWRIVVRFPAAYEIQEIDLLDGWFQAPAIDSQSHRSPLQRYPNPRTPAVEQASNTRVGQVFLGFSRFPAVRLFVDPGGTTTIRWTDMRFVDGPPSPDSTSPRANLFTATVRIDPDGRILEQRLGP